MLLEDESGLLLSEFNKTAFEESQGLCATCDAELKNDGRSITCCCVCGRGMHAYDYDEPNQVLQCSDDPRCYRRNGHGDVTAVCLKCSTRIKRQQQQQQHNSRAPQDAKETFVYIGDLGVWSSSHRDGSSIKNSDVASLAYLIFVVFLRLIVVFLLLLNIYVFFFEGQNGMADHFGHDRESQRGPFSSSNKNRDVALKGEGGKLKLQILRSSPPTAEEPTATSAFELDPLLNTDELTIAFARLASISGRRPQLAMTLERELPQSAIDAYYDALGAPRMLKTLSQLPDLYAFDNHMCHFRAYNIGKDVYLHHYNSNNISSSTPLVASSTLANAFGECIHVCQEGCYFGILLQHAYSLAGGGSSHAPSHNPSFSILSPNVLPALHLLELCNDEDGPVRAELSQLDCHRALGVVLIYMHSFNLPLALTECKQLLHVSSTVATGGNVAEVEEDASTSSSFTFSDAAKTAAFECSRGVYRMYAQEKSDDDKSPFFPCLASYDFPAACYPFIMEPKFHNQQYQEIAPMCLSMRDPRQRQGCFFGYGYHFAALIKRGGAPLTRVCFMKEADMGGNSRMDLDDSLMCVVAVAEYIEGGVLGDGKGIHSDDKKKICLSISDPELADLRRACLVASFDLSLFSAISPHLADLLFFTEEMPRSREDYYNISYPTRRPTISIR